MRKKIWITGGNGMLGSHFKRLLSKKSIDFLATSSNEINITNLESASEFVRKNGISHIINCAAYTNVDRAETHLKDAYQANAIGPHQLGIAARRHGSRVIHFSTDYVFNGKNTTPYKETEDCSPLGAYGISKFAGEMKLLEEHSEACIIRTSWLFGFPGKNFVDTMLKHMSEKDELKVVIDQIGKPTFCDDLVEATLDLINDSGVYHFANQNQTSWYHFAEEIRKQALALGFPVITKKIIPIASSEYPTAATRPAFSSLNTDKFETKAGKQPRSWQNSLRDYLTQLRNQQTASFRF